VMTPPPTAKRIDLRSIRTGPSAGGSCPRSRVFCSSPAGRAEICGLHARRLQALLDAARVLEAVPVGEDERAPQAGLRRSRRHRGREYSGPRGSGRQQGDLSHRGRIANAGNPRNRRLRQRACIERSGR
jgi:hypothetical protein